MCDKISENLDNKLYKVKYNTDSENHLIPDVSKCLQP